MDCIKTPVLADTLVGKDIPTSHCSRKKKLKEKEKNRTHFFMWVSLYYYNIIIIANCF